MVRKLFAVLLAALLLLPAAVLAQSRQVIDDAGVLSDSERDSIQRYIEQIETNHQVDIVVLITYDTPKDYSDSLYRVEAFADDYYDNGGFGMGPDYSGMLYLIDLNNRVQYISTGGVMQYYISDARTEAILDAAEPFLRRDDWSGAARAAIRRTGEYMEQGRERGVFLYDAETGKRLSGYHNPLEGYEVLIALGGGALVGLIFVGSVKGSYSLSGSTYRYDVSKKSSCTFTLDEEQYLREHVSRTARSTGSSGYSGGRSGGRSGGSRVHRSSSGRSHGGGGRRF